MAVCGSPCLAAFVFFFLLADDYDLPPGWKQNAK